MAGKVAKTIDELDKLKENERLFKELNRIELVERSDMRMLETSRHRLRSKLRRFEVPQMSSGSDALDVRMYDTHNPGFCYHCTGAIRASDKTPRKKFRDVFDVVRPMLFTNGEVDPDKVLCLHVLTAHYAKSGFAESSDIRPITSLMEEGEIQCLVGQGKKKTFSGAWNNILPCYVVDIQRNLDEVTEFSDEVKRHKDPLIMEAEEEMAKNFHFKYEKYLEENSDMGLALSNDRKRATMVPNAIGKIRIIPPHIYSLLGAAQELKIKQAIAEESRRKKFWRSSSSIKNIDDQSISFRLDGDEDAISARLTTAASIRGWRTTGASKISGFRSLSRRSATSSYQTDPSITTLNRASPRSSEVPPLSENPGADTQIVTIKPSNQAMARTVSKTSSTKSPFRNFSSTYSPRFPCSNSIMSGMFGPTLGEPRKIVKPIFINSPAESDDLGNREYKVVPILVNNQIQALVHSVMDILERVNPSKMRKIIVTANSPYEIRKMLIRPDIQLFIDSLIGQPLVSSPDSFVISMASVLYEIDPRVESSIEKELVATTLVVPPAPGLNRLIDQIRDNLFVNLDQKRRDKEGQEVETFGNQKQKLLESKNLYTVSRAEEKKDVFDVHTSCAHSDIQGNKMTCACCYAKWKDSLPDTERVLVPEFSFLGCNEDELTPENKVKYELNSLEIKSKGFEEKDRATKFSVIKNEPVHYSNSKQMEKVIPLIKKKRLSENSMKAEAKISGLKITEPRSNKDSRSILGLKIESTMSAGLETRGSKITLRDNVSSIKCQFKPWKTSRDPSYLDPDRVILRRMTNPQRILVGQMCASLKTRKINMEGIVKEKTPLAVLIAPVLSTESLRILTQGKRETRSRSRKRKIIGEKDDRDDTIPDKLTGPVLAKIRQAVAESETDRRLTSFLKNRI